jgi:hypothetical protein
LRPLAGIRPLLSPRQQGIGQKSKLKEIRTGEIEKVDLILRLALDLFPLFGGRERTDRLGHSRGIENLVDLLLA